MSNLTIKYFTHHRLSALQEQSVLQSAKAALGQYTITEFLEMRNQDKKEGIGTGRDPLDVLCQEACEIAGVYPFQMTFVIT